VGFSISGGWQQVEYWLPVQSDPIVDKPLEVYLATLNGQSQSGLAEIAPMVAQYLVGQEVEYVFRLRYPSNTLRVWLM
jgi:hypothetical protein